MTNDSIWTWIKSKYQLILCVSGQSNSTWEEMIIQEGFRKLNVKTMIITVNNSKWRIRTDNVIIMNIERRIIMKMRINHARFWYFRAKRPSNQQINQEGECQNRLFGFFDLKNALAKWYFCCCCWNKTRKPMWKDLLDLENMSTAINETHFKKRSLNGTCWNAEV